jgi:hypothetical protein
MDLRAGLDAVVKETSLSLLGKEHRSLIPLLVTLLIELHRIVFFSDHSKVKR